MSDPREPLKLVLLWHFHQPDYTDRPGGAPALPWTRLHALKDYGDMAAILARHPGVRVTVNAVPTLLEQLGRYAEGTVPDDPFLEITRRRADELNPEERRFVVSHFLGFKRDTMARDLPRVHELAAMRGEHGGAGVPASVVERFDEQDIRDLTVLFHLAWCGPSLRNDPVVKTLRDKGRGFDEADKLGLLAVQDRYLRGVLDSWKALAADGRIEFGTGPYFHPILPLLCELGSAHEALPTLALPEASFRHPEDARTQIIAGRERFREVFGFDAAGGWPPEGAISETALRILGECGQRWAVSDEEVLFDSLGERWSPGIASRSARHAEILYRPYRHADGPVVLFRDRDLSESIGAGYATWSPSVAAADFVRRLRRIRDLFPEQDGPACVTVALDGENAWELYPDGAAPFLDALYSAVVSDEFVRTCTVSDVAMPEAARSLSRVTAGSWIDATLVSWIGHREKNRAWKLLEAARRAIGDARGELSPGDPAGRAILAAEGSDWFWWLGDDHPTTFAAEFDAGFRGHLRRAYREAGIVPPSELDDPIRRVLDPGARHPAALIRPVLDGVLTDYYEWLAAAHIRPDAGLSPAERRVARALHFGTDGVDLWIRLDPVDGDAHRSLGGSVLRVRFPGYPDDTVAVPLPRRGVAEAGDVRMAVERIVEIAVPLAAVPADDEAYRFQVEIETPQGSMQRFPGDGTLVLPRARENEPELDWFV